MENIKPNKKRFDIMDYFSVMRIGAALLLSILIVFTIIFFVSQTPGLAIQKLMLGPLETKRSFFNVVVRAIPLVFTGLGLTLCLKSGIFNISSDASFYMGAVVASAIAIAGPLPNGLHQLALILAAAVVGGVISMLPVIVNKYTKVNPVVLAIMANSIFYYFGLSIISSFFLEKSGSWGSYKFPDHAKLGTMIKGTTLHYGFVIVIVVTLFVIFLMNKTSFGYKVRVTGSNPAFAKASGIKTGFVILMAQFIGGAIAGMGGAIEIVGVYKRFQWQSQTAYVWDGLLIYMLANGNPTFIPLTAFFIAYLRVGAEIMSRSTDLDPEIVTFLQGIIILLVASQRFLYFIKKRHDQKMSLRQAEAEEGGAAA